MTEEHDHPALFDDHRWAVGGAVALYTSAALLMLWVAVNRSSLQPLDDWFFDRMVSIENGFLTFGAQIFNYLGSVWVTAPLRAAVAVYLWARRRWARRCSVRLVPPSARARSKASRAASLRR